MGKVLTRPASVKREIAAPKSKPRFQKAIEAAEELSLSQREILIDVLKKRNIEARRHELEAEIEESLKEHAEGRTKSGTLEELLEDLDS